MTDYTTLTDVQLSLDEPFTFEEARALRDNPIAIAEGASDAPKIKNEAFDDEEIGAEKLQSGDDERDWVASRIIALGTTSAGAYVFAKYVGSSTIAFGGTASGSILETDGSQEPNTLPGTWRNVSYSVPSGGLGLFKRIS